jgi:uncharacterized protein YyaL (SSP411 family)
VTGYHRGVSRIEAARPFTNRLAAETSPYLLQHAHNPVDWYPWGSEALARAKAEDKPIFLSIGYAACHWCHVMERESFEDEATAADLRDGFIAIKVDREERPDLDQVYMTAVQAMTGSGGWPMSVFLTPDGKPFYGGTYFPNEPRHGMPSFRDVLAGVRRAWQDDRGAVESSGARLVEALVGHAHAGGAGSDSRAGLDRSILEGAVATLETSFDAARGGWGRAPKFPQSMTIEFLLRRSVGPDGDPGEDGRALAMARRTLDAMAEGGIHDQLGGGFHRYATDAAWLVPHFEQMLYDNAQLARVYLHAWQLTGDVRYRDVARGTLDYMDRELRTPDRAFAASQDADTDGVEGATFTWMAADIAEALGSAELGPVFNAAYGVTPAGNWEGKTILSRVRSDGQLAIEFGMPDADIRARLAKARSILQRRRAARPQPARDDKALAAWNGLAIGAFADAAAAFEASANPEEARLGVAYSAIGIQAAEAILSGLRGPDGRMKRSWKDDRASGEGVLEDYTHLADGLLALYEATFEERWFVAARELIDVVLDRFADPAGGFFDTADDHETLITRPKDVQDNALPSGNAMAALVLLRLAALTGEGRYRTAAEDALSQVTALVSRYPSAFGQWLVALDFALGSPVEVAIVGDQGVRATGGLLSAVRSGFRPNLVVALAQEEAALSAVPLLHDRSMVDGRPTAYVCRNFACRRPVTEPAALHAQLGDRDARP